MYCEVSNLVICFPHVLSTIRHHKAKNDHLMHIYRLTSSDEKQEMFVEFFSRTEENVDSNGLWGTKSTKYSPS